MLEQDSENESKSNDNDYDWIYNDICIDNELDISRLKLNDNNNDETSLLGLSHHSMNILCVIGDPYYWICIAQQNNILIYPLILYNENVNKEQIHHQIKSIQEMLKYPIYSKFPIAMYDGDAQITYLTCINQDNHDILLVSLDYAGCISIFNAHSIHYRIKHNKVCLIG